MVLMVPVATSERQGGAIIPSGAPPLQLLIRRVLSSLFSLMDMSCKLSLIRTTTPRFHTSESVRPPLI